MCATIGDLFLWQNRQRPGYPALVQRQGPKHVAFTEMASAHSAKGRDWEEGKPFFAGLTCEQVAGATQNLALCFALGRV